MMITSGEPVHWLRGGELHVGISLASGALVGVRHGDWAVLDRGELGRSFRLLLPVTGRRANYVDGSDQPPPVCQVGEDGRSVTAAWSAVRDERGVVHDIAVRTTIAVVGDGIVFSADIDNRAREAVVENVYFPDLGDVRPPPSGRLQTFAYSYATARRTGIWPNFANEPGYYGVDHPTFAATPLAEAPVTPPAPWILLDGATQGLHFRVDRPSAEPVTWFAELEPGYDDSMSSHAPAAPEIAGHAVTVHFAAVHLPFIRPGEHRELTPVAMTGYRGDWHAGVDLYIRRRAEWGMPTAAPPHWARQPHSWLQLQLNSPEGERRTTFAELPEIAAECAANGVAAIQLVGWNEGGQDQNNPAHDVDEQLGGRDELRRAIAECHRRGVHVVLFTKFTWADRATERFRRHLIREAVKDPYGDYYMHPGYRYQTMTQLLDINTKRLIPMCFLSERYLEVCREEFAKIVDLEPAGMLFDEAQHHGPALVCFDETHGHRAGAPVYANDRELVRLLRKTPNLPDDFLFACEAPYDWELEAHQLGYHRSEDPGHVP